MCPASSAAGTLANHILARLPAEEIHVLEPHLKHVEFERGAILCDRNAEGHLLFLNRGMICLMTSSDKGEMIEAGVLGAEGVCGGQLLLHAPQAPYRAVVQLPGSGVQIAWDILEQLLPRLPCLAKRIRRHLHLLLTQFAQSVLCSRFHPASQRLARWLLTSRDLCGRDTLAMTQEVLSHTVGVPRTWVNHVAGELQAQGLISYRSGVITIRAAGELERFACECYRVTRDARNAYLQL